MPRTTRGIAPGNRCVSVLCLSFAIVLFCSTLVSCHGQQQQGGWLADSEYGWAGGSYMDATPNPNFHTSSNERSLLIGQPFYASCYVSTATDGDRYLLKLVNSTGLESVVFPPWIMNPPRAVPTGSSTAFVQIHRIVQVWAYIESLDQPVVITEFLDNRTAKSDMRLLVPNTAPGYKPVDPLDPNRKSMFYQVRFEMRGVRPAIHGTRAGIPTREADGTYSVRVTAKFVDKALKDTSIPTPISGVPLQQTRLFVRLLVSDDSTQGEWVHVLSPVVEKFEMPVYNNTNADYALERSGEGNPYRTNASSSGILHGIVSGAVDKYGYANLVLKKLRPDARYTCYVSPVPTNSDLENLLNQGVTDPDYLLPALGALTQPMNPCKFRTPPKRGDYGGMHRPVKLWAGSCIEGSSAVFDGVPERDYDLLFFSGDNAYNDNLGKANEGDTGDDEEDFLRNYDRQQRGDGWMRASTSAASIHVKSDHEVQDAWMDFITFVQANSARFLFTPQELAVVDAVSAVSVNRAFMPVKKVSNAPLGMLPGSLVSNQRVIDAFNAFDRALPGSPYNKNPYARNYAEDWGQVKIIVLNSNPTVFSDGAIEYYRTHAIVPKGQEANPVVAPEANGTHIPFPAFEFFKSEMLKEKACRKRGEDRPPVTFVLFSDHIVPVYDAAKKAKYRAKFVEMAAVSAPSANATVAGSAYDKVFLQARGSTSDVFPEQFAALKKFFADEDISNVLFVTGDPHNSGIQAIDAKRAVYEAWVSSIGNYRANGITYQFLGNPAEKPSGSVAVGPNNYADIESNAFPEDPKEKPYIQIRLMYGQKEHARRRILLNKPFGRSH